MRRSSAILTPPPLCSHPGNLAAVPIRGLVRGRRGIAAHWAEVVSGQQPIRFQGEILGVGTTYGIAHWRVVIGQPGDRPIRVVDGILLAAFDGRGRTTSVRSWSEEASA